MSGSETDADPPAVITLRSGASAWRQTREGGLFLTRDDPHGFVNSLSDAERLETTSTAIDITAVGLEEIREEHGESIIPDSEAEADGEGYDVLDNSVADLKEELETGEYDDQLVDLYNAEQDDASRSTAIDAIQSRRDVLREQSESEEE